MKEGAVFPEHPRPGKPTMPTPPGLYVATGDSITFGTGITDTCTTYPDHPVDIEDIGVHTEIYLCEPVDGALVRNNASAGATGSY